MSVTATFNQNLRRICNNDDNYLRWKANPHNYNSGIHISSSHNNNMTTLSSTTTTTEPTKLQRKLLDAAATVRDRIGTTATLARAKEDLYFESSFSKSSSSSSHSNKHRGFCNWLIPGHLMVGQYPGQNPLNDGPSAEAVALHLQRLHQANVSVYCSLQSETPPQDDDNAWVDQKAYLKPEYRTELPRPFVQYAPLVRHYTNTTTSSNSNSPVFLHKPIADLSVPESQEPLQRLLLQLLEHMASDTDDNGNNANANKAIYIHCWGGLGRAGLIGACLLSLIYPHLSSQQILQWVQTGYASRVGHEDLEEQYSYSPQTCPQRAYVEAFVQQYQDLYQKHCYCSQEEH